jgi:hypothetical protein
VVPDAITPVRSRSAVTPFTLEVIVAPDLVRLFELIIEEDEIEPPMFEVIVFEAEERVFGTERFVIVAFVIVAFPPTMFARVAVPVAVMLVPVALSKTRLEI